MKKVGYLFTLERLCLGLSDSFCVQGYLMPAFPKPIHLAHQFIKSLVRPGDRVVDATLGNGHDALFLASLVGVNGKVYGFDIQSEAIVSSAQRMKDNNVSGYKFYEVGHEVMRDHVDAGVSVVMFNLGYLPNADKAVITTTDTTLPAVESSLTLLRVGGLLTVMCYPGHQGGDLESAAVLKWCGQLKREEFRVAQYGLVNAPNNPPFLVVVEKLK